MADKQQEQPSWVWADVMACSYCNHYQWVGTHGASQFCQNKDSPYYESSRPDWIGTDLTSEQLLRGCDKIDYNGQRIPAFLFKIIPKNSKLRNYPLDQLVDGFTDGMDLESETSVEEMTRGYQRQYDALLDMFKKHGTLKVVDGKLVPDDSDKKE